MRRFFTILLLTVVAGNISTYAQALTGKEREREVKTSGDYYYGEGVAEELSQSKQNALDDLKLMVLEAAMANNSSLMTADFEGFGDNVPFEVFDLEGRTKVLMYVPKSNLTFNSVTNRKVLVSFQDSGVGDSGSNVVEIAPQAEVAAVEEQQIVVPQSQPTVGEEPKVITITTNRPALQSSQAQPTATPVAAPQQQSSYSPSSPAATPSATRPSSARPGKTSDPIINQLLTIRQYEEARQLLNKYKLNGKLMYGQLATLSNPQSCYFLVLRNREIIDVLDKSDRSERRSLITGNVIDYKTTSGVVLWVCIL